MDEMFSLVFSLYACAHCICCTGYHWGSLYVELFHSFDDIFTDMMRRSCGSRQSLLCIALSMH